MSVTPTPKIGPNTRARNAALASQNSYPDRVLRASIEPSSPRKSSESLSTATEQPPTPTGSSPGYFPIRLAEVVTEIRIPRGNIKPPTHPVKNTKSHTELVSVEEDVFNSAYDMLPRTPDHRKVGTRSTSTTSLNKDIKKSEPQKIVLLLVIVPFPADENR